MSLWQDRGVRSGVTLSVATLALALMADLAGRDSALIFFGSVAFMGLGNGMLLPNANAGMMSVRPELAGTASGLGGAMAVAGGAALAALAAAFLNEGSGAAPLLVIMVAVGAGSILSAL